MDECCVILERKASHSLDWKRGTAEYVSVGHAAEADPRHEPLAYS